MAVGDITTYYSSSCELIYFKLRRDAAKRFTARTMINVFVGANYPVSNNTIRLRARGGERPAPSNPNVMSVLVIAESSYFTLRPKKNWEQSPLS